MNEIERIISGSLTDPEWHAVIFLALFIFSVTEFLKRAWRRLAPVRFNYEDVYFIAAGAGMVGGYFIWPINSKLHWSIAGVIVAFLTAIAHRWVIFWIRWKLPALAKIISSNPARGDRRQPPEIDDD